MQMLCTCAFQIYIHYIIRIGMEQNNNIIEKQPIAMAAAIMTFNSMRTIPAVLESLKSIADKIVVVDSGSTDGTIEYCRKSGCRVFHLDWQGYIQQRSISIEKCLPAVWVLSLDSDEILEPELQSSIRKAIETNDPDISGYEFNRKMWYLGGWLNHVYFPEWRLRLVRPEKAKVIGDQVHEKIVVDGKTARLDGICRHDSYADLQDHAVRQIRYASTYSRSKIKGHWWHLFTSPLGAVWKMLIRKRCFMDGKRGWIAFAMAINFKLLKQAFQMLHRLEQEQKDKRP